MTKSFTSSFFPVLAAVLTLSSIQAHGQDKNITDSVKYRFTLPADLREFGPLMTGQWGNDMPDTFAFSSDTTGFWVMKENGFKGKKKGWSTSDPFILRHTNGRFYMVFVNHTLIIEIKSLDYGRIILWFPDEKFYRELKRRRSRKHKM